MMGRGGYSRLFLLLVAVAVPAVAVAQDRPAEPLADLSALDRKIADLDIEENAAKRELTTIDSRIGSLERRIRTHAAQFYRTTRVSRLPLGGGFMQFLKTAASIERSRRTLVAEARNVRELRQRVVSLGATLDQNRATRLTLASQRTAFDAARMAATEESDRDQAFARAFSTGESDYVAVYGANGGGGSAGSFAAAKGRLTFPVIGRAEVRPAKREETSGPAAEIRAPLGSAVRAVFAGRVAFADRYGSYGKIVILDHGDHYYTVSGNLARIDVRVGDDLSAGEKLGTVGDEGQGAMLYFELRRGSQTIAPGPWLGF